MSKELFDLSDRTALITGATGHLGSAVAKALASAGAHVVLNSRSYEKCALLEEEIRSVGGSAERAVFDVTDGDAMENYFSGWSDRPLHVLINNAYSGYAGTIQSSTVQSYADGYDIAVTASHRLVRLSLENLRLAVRQGGDASIINIASMYGIVSPDLRIYADPYSSNPPFYGAAKAALIQWTRYAACEFGREGIRVNSLSPGAFPSEAVQEESPDFIDVLCERVPMERIGQPSELAGPAVFLASVASSYVNGSNIVVDGGWTAW